MMRRRRAAARWDGPCFCPAQFILVLLLLGLAAGFGAGRASAQETTRMRFLAWSYQDAGALAQEIGSRTPLYLLGSTAVLGATSTLDPSLLREVQEEYRGPFAAYLDVTNELGGPQMTPITAGIFAVTLVTEDERLQDAAFTSFQSLLYAGVLTTTLKHTFGRFRPEAGVGAYRFQPFTGNTSFPSGHTTTAFAVLTPWVLYYPNAATYGLFALSVGTAVARIALDKHWPTDVLAGGAIGFLTARYLTRRHQQLDQGPRLEMKPLVGRDAVGVLLSLRLD